MTDPSAARPDEAPPTGTGERRSLPPLQVDSVRIVLIGTACWVVALVVVLLLGDRVARVWTWTCVAGIGLALLGTGIMRWQGQVGRGRGQSRGAQSVSTSKSAVS